MKKEFIVKSNSGLPLDASILYSFNLVSCIPLLVNNEFTREVIIAPSLNGYSFTMTCNLLSDMILVLKQRIQFLLLEWRNLSEWSWMLRLIADKLIPWMIYLLIIRLRRSIAYCAPVCTSRHYSQSPDPAPTSQSHTQTHHSTFNSFHILTLLRLTWLKNVWVVLDSLRIRNTCIDRDTPSISIILQGIKFFRVWVSPYNQNRKGECMGEGKSVSLRQRYKVIWMEVVYMQ